MILYEVQILRIHDRSLLATGSAKFKALDVLTQLHKSPANYADVAPLTNWGLRDKAMHADVSKALPFDSGEEIKLERLNRSP